MPRGARFAFQNAFYHVFNRGINKQQIFHTEQDYKFFLDRLLVLKKKYDHSLYAFCLMPNHFHLSIQTRKITISKIMASLGTSYSMHYNRTYNHFGPLFQNRFKSILVENDAYFVKLSQYIYLNPQKAGIVDNPLSYPYSSIREALGREPLYFLDQDIVRLTGETSASKEQYRRFVLSADTQDFSDLERLFEEDEAVLGSERFSVSAQKKYIRRAQKNA